MSIFGNLTNDDSIKAEGDSLGGGKFLAESGIYDGTIEMAYADKSSGGAHSVNLHIKTDDGTLIRVTEYVTSGTNKGGLNTYIDKNSGEKRYLPGYSKMDSMSKLAAGKDLTDLASEEKVVKRYDHDAKKEVPMKTNVLVDLIDKRITVGVIKQVVDKNVKNTSTGAYEPTGETREENVIDKFFRERDGLTTAEIIAGSTEAAFKVAWADKNAGVTRNLAKGASGTVGAPASGATSGAPAAAGSKPPSLFS